MESGDLINLPASSSSGNGSENIRSTADCEPRAADSAPTNSDVNEEQLNEDFLGNEGDFGNNDSQSLLVSESDKDLIESTNIVQVSAELAEVEEKINCFSSAVHDENGNSIRVREKDRGSISGLKRTRETLEEQHPSVSVLYNSLPSGSKRKLEKLLQEWSEWHARHYRSSADSNEVLESGEDMYFPALYVGVDKPSSVSFWMDNQTRDPQSKEVITLDSNSVPLYDRGFALGLTPADGSGNLERGLELGDASRCFNCSSYNHSLKECPKPRDNAAVNNARKQQKSRRNQNATSSRNPTRYYQSSPGGKYDGLKPGSLDAETRKLLGLGELDPPPWLNRMREIGYPPGYLDPEDEDQPSGITIFAEEESKEEKEDGEILDTELILDTEDTRELPRKKSVKFLGINAPIPENADERRWTAGHSSHDLSRSRSNRRFNPSSEPSSRYYQEQRWTKDYRDDGPPGVDPITSPLVSSYPPRYGSYDSSSLNSYSPRGNNLIPRSPSFERTLSDRGRRSLIVYETDYGRWSDDLTSLDSSSSRHYKDRRDQHYHHSRR